MNASRATIEALARSPLASFRPWSHEGRSPQRDLLTGFARYDSIILRGGNRMGKTEIGAFVTSAVAQGWPIPGFDFSRPRTIWISALDREFIGVVLWPKMQRYIDHDRVKSVSYFRRQSPEIPNSVAFKDGSVIVFKSQESGAKKYQGGDVDLAWFDEEHEADVIEELRARLVDRGGKLLGTLTPVSRLEHIRDIEREDSTLLVRGSMTDAAEAGIIDKEGVKRFLGNLSERQRRLRDLGDVSKPEGLVWPEFDRARHVIEASGSTVHFDDLGVDLPNPLPKSWPRYAAMDFGFSVPAAIVVAAVDPETERIFIERVYHANAIRITTWARFIARELPTLNAPLVCDHDAGERAELEAAGIRTVGAKKAVVAGLEAVEARLVDQADGAPGLIFVEDSSQRTSETGRCDASPLVHEIEGYSYPKPTGGADRKDLPLKKDDHACDALRYLVMYIDRAYGRSTISEVAQAIEQAPQDRASAAFAGLGKKVNPWRR